jgi:hypothetical protein
MTVAHSAARRKGGTQRKNTRLDDVQSKKFIGTTIELKPTPVGCVCSAFAVDITGPSWLSFHRYEDRRFHTLFADQRSQVAV